MQASENLVWGVFCQDLPARGLSVLSNLSFLVRPGQPVSSPRPMRIEEQARAGAVKDGALAPPGRGLVLDGLRARRHTCCGRDDDVRGEPACGARILVPHPCIRWVQRPDHDAVMRIGCEAPRRRTHSAQRHESRGFRRDPATSNCHRRPVASLRADRGPKPSSLALASPPFSVQDGGRHRRARCHRARSATGRLGACAPGRR